MTDAPQPEQDSSRFGATESPPGVPRWVKALAVVGVILLLVLSVALVVGGNHGPNRHGMEGPSQPHRESVAVASAGPHGWFTAW